MTFRYPRESPRKIFKARELEITSPLIHRLEYIVSRRYYRKVKYHHTSRDAISYKLYQKRKKRRYHGHLKQHYFNKQRYRYNKIYMRILMASESKTTKTLEVFKLIYIDRHLRYNLYFTQGIIDPYGDEANTWLILTTITGSTN